MIIFITLCLCICHINVIVADAPEYTEFWNRMYETGEKQTEQYILDLVLLPEVNSNPSIIPWIWDRPGLTRDHVLISWCGSPYACPYQVMSIGPNKTDWQIVKKRDNFEVFLDHGGVGRYPMLVGDIRLYMVEDTVRLTYVAVEGRIQTYHNAQVYYDNGLDALYVLQSEIHKMSIEKEVGVRSQKNWSPFVYDFSTDPKIKYLDSLLESYGVEKDKIQAQLPVRRNGYENLFIYSTNPHRIVHGNETLRDGLVDMHTVASSEVISPPGQEFWKYGEARGGTPSVLVDTVHGPRFVTLFHSQCSCAVPYIKTYYMGGYLFNPQPPFEITHMTMEPIIPKPLYDENNGWAFKAIDYINFPTGMVVRDGIMHVTLGRNDRSGYAMIMNLTGFVDSMRPVRTKILLNTFFKHISVSAAEQGKGVSGGHNLNAGRKVHNETHNTTKRRDLTNSNNGNRLGDGTGGRNRNLRSSSLLSSVGSTADITTAVSSRWWWW